jgi:hypothetical protein
MLNVLQGNVKVATRKYEMKKHALIIDIYCVCPHNVCQCLHISHRFLLQCS